MWVARVTRQRGWLPKNKKIKKSHSPKSPLVLFQRIPGSENLFICSFTTSQAAMIGWLVELFLLSDINQYPFFPPLSLLMNVHPKKMVDGSLKPSSQTQTFGVDSRCTDNDSPHVRTWQVKSFLWSFSDKSRLEMQVWRISVQVCTESTCSFIWTWALENILRD